jgi:hypothetical protein
MSSKRRFKPVVKQVRLNPEQAVLSCNCFDSGRLITAIGYQDETWCGFYRFYAKGNRRYGARVYENVAAT